MVGEAGEEGGGVRGEVGVLDEGELGRRRGGDDVGREGSAGEDGDLKEGGKEEREKGRTSGVSE